MSFQGFELGGLRLAYGNGRREVEEMKVDDVIRGGSSVACGR